ncbi:hypothetical protein SAMN05216420_102284 [Nitrosospira sp. Nl5]|nr:hypothetical protein SAMN05216420_102284 [Nitrosospira sp. Nl5]
MVFWDGFDGLRFAPPILPVRDDKDSSYLPLAWFSDATRFYVSGFRFCVRTLVRMSILCISGSAHMRGFFASLRFCGDVLIFLRRHFRQFPDKGDDGP